VRLAKLNWHKATVSNNDFLQFRFIFFAISCKVLAKLSQQVLDGKAEAQDKRHLKHGARLVNSQFTIRI
jgi:hypothetical protein